MAKDVRIDVRVTGRTKAALAGQAAKERRTLANFVTTILDERADEIESQSGKRK